MTRIAPPIITGRTELDLRAANNRRECSALIAPLHEYPAGFHVDVLVGDRPPEQFTLQLHTLARVAIDRRLHLTIVGAPETAAAMTTRLEGIVERLSRSEVTG